MAIKKKRLAMKSKVPSFSGTSGGESKQKMDLDAFLSISDELRDLEKSASKSKIFPMADEGDLEDNFTVSRKQGRGIPLRMETFENSSAAAVDDVDPLDAYMFDVTKEVDKLIGKSKVKNLRANMAALSEFGETESVGMASDSGPIMTISLEDIQRQMVDGQSEMPVSPASVEKFPESEADAPPPEEDSFHDEFMKKFREQVDQAAVEEEKLLEERRKMILEETQQEELQELEEEIEMRREAGKEDDFFQSNVPKRKQKKELMKVDHSKINYIPFRKNFYIECPDISELTDVEVESFKKENDDIKVKGKDCPKPIRTFYQCGLPDKILDVIEKCGYSKPFPVQCQAIPAIMSGRDVIGIAKTGSGKTLAFLLPMIRHVLDQPPLGEYDGPIALIISPTRELAVQIATEVKRFGKAVGISCACVYGGAGISEQIAELRRGCQVAVCTPGRMIDMLTSNGGRVTNLRRITYVVLDEADRMFDLGFAPQIMLMIDNIRPDRQTVLFSATFPKQVEQLARKILNNKPILIEVGGRSTVSNTITQKVEIIPEEDDRFVKLLEILKDSYETTLTLVFVSTQDLTDRIFRDLMIAGYSALSLNGSMNQEDRSNTISDFKRGETRILVATSVCARGLDVPDLGLVINYNVPNHYEDYVHRVGRTGRAGRKGTAITFITPDEDKYAPMLMEALEKAKHDIPPELRMLCNTFKVKRDQGLISTEEAKIHSGYITGKGFKYDETEETAIKQRKKQEMRSWGEDVSDDEAPEIDEEGEYVTPAQSAAGAPKDAAAEANAVAGVSMPSAAAIQATIEVLQKQIDDLSQKSMQEMQPVKKLEIATKIRELVEKKSKLQTPALAAASNPAVPATESMMHAQAVAQRIAQSLGLPQVAAPMPIPGVAAPVSATAHHLEELEINDYPQNARWKVTRRNALLEVIDRYSVAITTRGLYYGPGKPVPPNQRKLYLAIEGAEEYAVKQAKRELKQMLDEASAGQAPSQSSSKYSVV